MHFAKVLLILRPICPTCGSRPVAINYYKDEEVHYRSQCDACRRLGKSLFPKTPAWAKTGYKKKPQCERCGFKSKIPEQIVVYHIDGNLKNSNWANLKCICLNCQQEINKLGLPWKTNPILPDR